MKMTKRGNYFIVVYDKEDNYIRDFESIEECANYFHISRKCVSDYILKEKLREDKYRLFKINELDTDIYLNKSL